MGQHPAPGKLITNWYQSQTQSDVICNKYTKDQYQRHYVLIQDKRQLQWYDRRVKEHYPYICRVVFYHPAQYKPNQNKQQNQSTQNPSKTYFVYTDRMLPIQTWSIDTSLCILKGFNRLITNQNYEYFHIESNMIGQNEHGIVKVWVNSNPAINSALKSVSSEEQMLANIAGILMKNDKTSASLLINCKNFKEAIKNISKKKLDDAHFSQMYSCRDDIKKYQKKQYIHQKKDQHPNWPAKNSKEAVIGKNNFKNNEFWTIRNNHDDRQYISQGKRQNSNLMDMINQNRNASSTTKNNPNSLERPSLNPSLNYNLEMVNNNYNHAQNYGYQHNYVTNIVGKFNPQSYPIVSAASPKGRQGFEFLQANFDKKSQNNKNELKVGINERQKHYKQDHKIEKNIVQPSKNQSIKIAQPRKKYTSAYLQKMQENQQFNQGEDQYIGQYNNQIENTDNMQYSYTSQNPNFRQKNTPNPKKTYFHQGQLKGALYEDPSRMLTYNNIHDAFKFQQMNVQRNKTQDFQKQFRNDIPSFIPKKRQQHLGDHLTNPYAEGKTYSATGKQEEKKQIQVLQQGKTKKIQQYHQYKQQRLTPTKVIQSKSRRFINNVDNAGLIPKKNTKQQQVEQKKNILPPSNYKPSGSQQLPKKINLQAQKNIEKKKHKQYDKLAEEQQGYEKEIEDRRKVKQQKNIQWKKQFGSILCLEDQDTKNTPKKEQIMHKSNNYVIQHNNAKQKRNATQKYGPTHQGSKKQITMTNITKIQKQSPNDDDYPTTGNSQVLRDKMIKQKVQRKRADFADLKQRAMKILF